ncbi:hypothetical protein ONE63_002623 [Megalurothrips usitatus]|uniref:THAP-type domain-containing protein n=1 Tax=Megalurothrips usitatus TaxID=439358 RepID=A0AAV7X8Q6_9NEOP|nr:hypothetical protein ONE63_002623 [Megalurothrips usitatus]
MPKNHSFRCWVRHCVNARRRTRIPNSHFHAFPVKNTERCRRWLQAVGYEDLVYLPLHSLKMRYVCSEHFTENDYGKTGSNPSLLFTATPSIFPPGTIPLSDEILEEWPPKLASDKGDIPQMETAMLDSLDHTEDSSDKLLASVVSAGILQPAPPKVTKVTPVMQAEQSANQEEEKLSPLPQELLLKHIKNNSGTLIYLLFAHSSYGLFTS